MRESGKVTEQRRVILDFENDLLKTVRGDVIPSGGDKTSADENIGTRVINPSAKPEEKSLISKLKFWEKDEAEVAKDTAAAKAKLEADEAAKKAASITKENVVAENVAPAEQTQSMLAVPIEVAPLVEVPAVVKAAEVVVPEIVVPEVQKPEVTKVNTALAPVEPKATVSVAESAPLPVTPPPYDSPSGMKFDRTLRLAAEDMETVVQQAAMPRAGNKTAPKPKDLPAESAPSFFDKMLEKIGF